MKESVIYQSILKEGMQQGIQEGVKQLVMMQLNSSFGTLESRLMAKIDSLSVQQLQELATALLHFTSKEDLDAWLGYPQP